jgi:hypothetical protein
MTEDMVLLQRLARAEERIAMGTRIIARQREVLAELAANGQVDDEVTNRLAGFEQMHETNLAICEDIKMELAETRL